MTHVIECSKPKKGRRKRCSQTGKSQLIESRQGVCNQKLRQDCNWGGRAMIWFTSQNILLYRKYIKVWARVKARKTICLLQEPEQELMVYRCEIYLKDIVWRLDEILIIGNERKKETSDTLLVWSWSKLYVVLLSTKYKVIYKARQVWSTF